MSDKEFNKLHAVILAVAVLSVTALAATVVYYIVEAI